MQRAWSLLVAAASLACSTSPSALPPRPVVKIPFEERPLPYNKPDSPWGGWTDGTVLYDPAAYPGVDLYLYAADWGLRGVPALAVNTDNPDASGYDAELAALKQQAGITNIVADVHAKGTGYTQTGWLSGAWLTYDPQQTGEDLSVFAGGGVVFLGKAGDDPSADKSLQLMFASDDFYPVQDLTNPPTGVHCGYGGAAQCWDFPTTRVDLGPHWSQYVLPFSNFRQGGFGLAIPDFCEARGLTQQVWIAFSLPRQVTFDFWIAAFGFYKAKDYPF
jgi:hypothetical protein